MLTCGRRRRHSGKDLSGIELQQLISRRGQVISSLYNDEDAENIENHINTLYNVFGGYMNECYRQVRLLPRIYDDIHNDPHGIRMWISNDNVGNSYWTIPDLTTVMAINNYLYKNITEPEPEGRTKIIFFCDSFNAVIDAQVVDDHENEKKFYV